MLATNELSDACNQPSVWAWTSLEIDAGTHPTKRCTATTLLPINCAEDLEAPTRASARTQHRVKRVMATNDAAGGLGPDRDAGSERLERVLPVVSANRHRASGPGPGEQLSDWHAGSGPSRLARDWRSRACTDRRELTHEQGMHGHVPGGHARTPAPVDGPEGDARTAGRLEPRQPVPDLAALPHAVVSPPSPNASPLPVSPSANTVQGDTHRDRRGCRRAGCSLLPV